MISNWQTKKLEDVCIIDYGTRVVRNRDGGEKYPVYGGGGATFFMDKYNRVDCTIVSRFAMSEQCVRKVSGKFFLNDSGLSVSSKNQETLLQEFLDIELLALSKNIFSLGRGTAQKNLDVTSFRNLNLAYPDSIFEQRRIVATLDEAFASIDKAKENTLLNLQNSRELFYSYMQNIFNNVDDNWTETTLGDKKVIEIIDGDRGKNYPSKQDFSDTGYCLFMNTKNVRPNGFNFETTMFITKEKDEILGNGKLKRNDVVMTTRGTIGNLGVYNSEVPYDNIRINSGMLIFRPNLERILPEYLFEVLQSEISRKQISKQTSGAAQPQLPIKTLRNFVMPIPNSVENQRIIVAKLKVISVLTHELESIYKQKISYLDELKQSILTKAFAGEL